MEAYYYQPPGELWPIYGASCIEDARFYFDKCDWRYIVASHERVFMNPYTGSVDFASGWPNKTGLIEVSFDAESMQWIEKS